MDLTVALYRTLDGNNDIMFGDKANLKPALVVLYSLALLQGVLFYYWTLSASEEKSLVRRVAQAYNLGEKDKALESISDYLHEVRMGCEKDPSFAMGRNLLTYAVGLMESNSPANYVPFRGKNPGHAYPAVESSGGEAARADKQHGCVGISSWQCREKRYVHDGRKISEMRFCAMRIVAHFANEIRLDKIMYGIRNISSLLEDEGSDSDSDSDSDLEESDLKKYQVYFTGMKILSELAKDEDNLKHMSNTDGNMVSPRRSSR
nr:unnamed protein product [Digitaria exilis]